MRKNPVSLSFKLKEGLVCYFGSKCDDIWNETAPIYNDIKHFWDFFSDSGMNVGPVEKFLFNSPDESRIYILVLFRKRPLSRIMTRLKIIERINSHGLYNGESADTGIGSWENRKKILVYYRGLTGFQNRKRDFVLTEPFGRRTHIFYNDYNQVVEELYKKGSPISRRVYLRFSGENHSNLYSIFPRYLSAVRPGDTLTCEYFRGEKADRCRFFINGKRVNNSGDGLRFMNHDFENHGVFNKIEELERGKMNDQCANNLVRKARKFALDAHAGQLYGDQPYLIHLEAVANLAGEYGEEAEIIAWLHDTVEDTAVTLDEISKEFGSFISECVAILSDQSENISQGENGQITVKLSREEKKKIANRKMSLVNGSHQIALVVKACDRLANIRACVAGDTRDEKKFRKYSEEHAHFKKAAFRPGLCDAVWEEIEHLFGEVAW